MTKREIAYELNELMKLIMDDHDVDTLDLHDLLGTLKDKLINAERDLKDGATFHITVPKSFRWLPYEENSNPFKHGKLGRFQERSMTKLKAGDPWRNSVISEQLIKAYFKEQINEC
jgi:hypothetical protein